MSVVEKQDGSNRVSLSLYKIKSEMKRKKRRLSWEAAGAVTGAVPLCPRPGAALRLLEGCSKAALRQPRPAPAEPPTPPEVFRESTALPSTTTGKIRPGGTRHRFGPAREKSLKASPMTVGKQTEKKKIKINPMLENRVA